MSELVITSPANPRLKGVLALRRRRVRDERRETIVDGFEELSLALDAGVVPHTLYWCPDLVESARAGLLDRVRQGGGETIRLGRRAFEKISYREGPDGFLAVVAVASRDLADLDIASSGPVLLCQGVEKPGNLGAILRTADGAGVAAVVAADPVTDWGNPNVIRASKGTVFSVPVACASTQASLAWVRARGMRLIATTPDTDIAYTDVDYDGPIAVAVGAEKTGLTDDLLAAADVRVRIPMVGLADSLNVATSAALVVYEAVRRRRSLGGMAPATGDTPNSAG